MAYICREGATIIPLQTWLGNRLTGFWSSHVGHYPVDQARQLLREYPTLFRVVR